RLRHLRAALDVLLTRFVVELGLRTTARTAVRSQSAATPGRDVLGRRAAGLARLAGARTFFVHGARRDLLGGVVALTAVEQSFLDVVVLPFPLVTPLLSRHR